MTLTTGGYLPGFLNFDIDLHNIWRRRTSVAISNVRDEVGKGDWPPSPAPYIVTIIDAKIEEP